MIVAAHQPLYVPWLGYFDKIARADCFVVLDDVQYARQNYQNRNRVKLPGGVHWLTVPVERGAIEDRICDKRIAALPGAPDWRARTMRTLDAFYGKAPHYARYRDALADTFRRDWERLLDLDLHLMRRCMEWLGVRTPMVLASGLGVTGHKTALILDVCRRTGATTYLSGAGASRSYLDAEALAALGVRVVWQDFTHPIYPQLHDPPDFLSHLSVLDVLFNCGPAAARFLGRPAPQHDAAAVMG